MSDGDIKNMEFRIADTFTDSLAKLTGDEQKAVKTTAFDLQLNPANPGMQFHRLDKARDKNFWSVRVSRDIRLITHKTESSLLLCYVGHHDAAYQWAERRKLETHPKTGAAQLVEIRETVREVAIPAYGMEGASRTPKTLLFSHVCAEELLEYGVPPEWIDEVYQASEDSLFEVTEHLPVEAAEALLELATGGTPQVKTLSSEQASPFDHPDAQRRFRLMADSDELRQALDFPWIKWVVFLHPAQRDLVERDYSGPARVAGSAGTGKTVVALHRAVFLANHNEDARILVTTFSNTLASALKWKLRYLIGNKPKVFERIEVCSIGEIGLRLYTKRLGKAVLIRDEELKSLLLEASTLAKSNQFSEQFIWTEWNDVVDAWQLSSWEEYRDVVRLGRKTRLGAQHRQVLWAIFEKVREMLDERNLLTVASMLSRVTEHLTRSENLPFEFAIVDEAQDIGVSELRLLSALGANRANALFFAGDLGQRIFQTPFSWKSLGVDVRGRSRTLRINYRTSHQIRLQADRLLAPKIADVDGNEEERSGTISAFEGPEPTIEVFDSIEDEEKAVAEWLKCCSGDGIKPSEIGVFVRSSAQLVRARKAVAAAELKAVELEIEVETEKEYVSILTMHMAKGLEFRAVAVIACDDEVLPLQERIANVGDDADLEEIYNTERHLLYVACTRARDRLFVSGVEPTSEFLDDLAPADTSKS